MDELFDKWTVQARKGALELVIMAALARRERYAFELIGAIREKAAIEMPEGTIYPLLIRLAKDELVETRWQSPAPGEGASSPRKYYALTARGRAMLDRMIGGWRSLNAAVVAMTGDE